MNDTNSAAGSQPGVLPIVDTSVRADLKHYSPGRAGNKIEYVVLHSTEGSNSLHWLSDNPNSAVSVHVLVDRDGIRHDLVSYSDTAWHVGKAIPPVANSNSIGIELENLSKFNGVAQEYTAAQLNTAAHWVSSIEYSYGIPWERVVRHGDVALPPGRRHDPSNFDMVRFKKLVDAWTLFFASVPPSELAHYIQGTPLPAPIPPAPPADFPFRHAPTISLKTFTRVLTEHHSPIEYTPELFYNTIVNEYHLDPNPLLGMFYHESQLGRFGVAVVTRSWGNVREPQQASYVTQDSPYHYVSGGVDYGNFAKYPDFLSSLRDVCLRLLGEKYLGSNPAMTTREVIAKWAPIGDHGNKPDAYYDALIKLCQDWQTESKL